MSDEIKKVLWLILAVVIAIHVVVIGPLALVLGPTGCALGMLISSVASAIAATVILITRKEESK